MAKTKNRDKRKKAAQRKANQGASQQQASYPRTNVANNDIPNYGN